MKSMIRMVSLTACVVAILAGCSSFPLEESMVLDNRPLLAFKTDADPASFTFAVDGIEQGSVEKYLEGKAGLRILPGTHVVTIRRKDGTSSSERIFVSDGVRRTLVVK